MSPADRTASISVTQVGKIFYPAPTWLRFLVKSPITSEIHALRSVSLNVEPGEVCALVGPNGAGKTTLFRILVGLTTPTSGTAHVLGHDVVTESLAIRRMIGWMPTSSQSLFGRHSCIENLRFHGRLRGRSGSGLDKSIDEVLEMVGLADAKNNAVLSLSAGMLARLQLARALLHNPRLLILDEPTASVDPVAAYGIINLILEIIRERRLAAFVSSHRLDEIEALHSHVLLLHRGEILFDGDLDHLRERLSRPRIELVFTSGREAERAAATLTDAPFVESTQATGGPALRIETRHGTPVGEIYRHLGSHLDQLVQTTEIKVPLREMLAEVYGIDESPGKDRS